MLETFIPKKEQIYVQCWHGTPLKKLGYDLVNSDNAMNTQEEIFKKYKQDTERLAYLISPSPFATEKFTSAWNLEEFGKEDIIIEEGYPRNDRLINTTPEERTMLRKQLGVDDKKVILYAPTWRDNQHTSGEGYTYKTEVDFDKLREQLGDEYVILFRAHYLVANSFDFEKYKGFVEDVSSYSDINELYIAADILVTDYSSVFFDYANLRKPVIFYMYDLDVYKDELRGLYMDLSELPGPVVRTQEELTEKIRGLDEWTCTDDYLQKYDDFVAKFAPYEDGQSAARVVRAVFGSEAAE
jgi:CDP-glycerol glycerophosphotransferase